MGLGGLDALQPVAQDFARFGIEPDIQPVAIPEGGVDVQLAGNRGIGAGADAVPARPPGRARAILLGKIERLLFRGALGAGRRGESGATGIHLRVLYG